MPAFLSVAMAALIASQALPAYAQASYDNPVDNKTYQTPGQFRTYQPVSPRDVRGQRITTRQVRLLTGQPELGARVNVNDLAAYIKAIEVRAYAELARNKSAMVAMVQFNCQPQKCEVKLASQGKAEEATLQALYDAMSTLPPLDAKGEVVFQLTFNVGS